MPAIAVNAISVTDPSPPAPPPGVVIAFGSVLCNGQPVATIGSKITPHGDPKVQPICQSGPIIVEGLPNILVNGQPVAHIGSACNCGHHILTGIPTVIVS